MPLYKSLILLFLLLVSSSSILALKYAFFLFLKKERKMNECQNKLHAKDIMDGTRKIIGRPCKRWWNEEEEDFSRTEIRNSQATVRDCRE